MKRPAKEGKNFLERGGARHRLWGDVAKKRDGRVVQIG